MTLHCSGPHSGLVATAQTEFWSPRKTRIGLRIFAFRSSAALFVIATSLRPTHKVAAISAEDS